MYETGFEVKCLTAIEAIGDVLTDPELPTYQPLRTALLDALKYLEMDVTCGDCIEGRCHWGGQQSAESTADAAAGREHREECGCDRHEASVAARNRARALLAAGVVRVETAKNDAHA